MKTKKAVKLHRGGGCVKPKIEDVRVKLAKLLHESGRKAVEQRLVCMKGDDIPVKPFCEWDDLPNDARSRLILMAAILLDKRRRATLKGIFASR